jgi:hypothetical protein
MSEPVIEVLTFDGCPHALGALELVERVIADTGVDAVVRRVDIPDNDAAAAQRFLGSPTIRVNGRDIEPGVSERNTYVRSCRVYSTDAGLRGEPDERWLRDALHSAE